MQLKIDAICKNFKDVKALDNFSIELNVGIYGLLGPNGSGKTTLMRIIVGEIGADSGRILYNGEDAFAMDERYRELLGYLPQDVALYNNFTAKDFLLYVSALKGLSKKQANEKSDEMLELVSLSDVAKKRCGKFSGGMKRRLGIAQALLNDPKILILDEPTAGVDTEERIKFRNMLARIASNRIILYTTHIVSDIELIAKELILIKKGKILKNGAGDILTGEIHGKIWQATVNEEQYQNFINQNGETSVTNVLRDSGGVTIRMISEAKPFDSAEIVKPTYEELYTYYFTYQGMPIREGDSHATAKI